MNIREKKRERWPFLTRFVTRKAIIGDLVPLSVASVSHMVEVKRRDMTWDSD